jgi:hypothetical protein
MRERARRPPQPAQERGQPSPGGAVGRRDGVDRHHPHRPPHRPGGRGERQREPDGRAPDERAGLEAHRPDRHRQRRRVHRPHRRHHQQPHADAEGGAEQRDLRADDEGAEGELPARRPERHADADLPALRLDHPAGQVEGPEGGPGEDQPGEDVPELGVALDVVVERPVRVLVLRLHDGHAEVGRLGVERGPDRPLRGGHVGARPQRDHEVVDPARPPGQVAGGVERHEHDGEVGLREEAALLGHHQEVLGREALADVAHRRAAGDPDRAAHR